ncbi:hypothetical protein ACFSVJ_06265 [Prauserella oleivorans]
MIIPAKLTLASAPALVPLSWNSAEMGPRMKVNAARSIESNIQAVAMIAKRRH